MKQFITIGLIAFLLVACKKENDLKRQFAGKWEAAYYSGYPFNSPGYAPGNGNIILLTEDGIFERRKFDTVLFKGTYTLTEKKDCIDVGNKWFFSTDESYSPDRFLNIKDSLLTITYSNCYADAGTGYYRRVK